MMKKQQAKPRRLGGNKDPRQLTKNDLLRMRIPRNFWEASFDLIRPAKSDHKKHVGTYLKKIDYMYKENVGLGLWGKNGSGKTAILAMILKEARRYGFTGLFVRAEELRVADLKNREFEPGVPLLYRAQTVDFLGIDDLGKEHRGETSYAVNLLHGVFRSRSDERLPTIFTTNFCVTDRQFLEAYKASMVEILRECCQVICVEGHDFRDGRVKHISKMFK